MAELFSTPDLFSSSWYRSNFGAVPRAAASVPPLAPELQIPGAASAPAAAPAAPGLGAKPSLPFRVGKFAGKMTRLSAPLGLGAMGFGMADQAAAIEADPESKPFMERALQVLSGADVTGFGGWLGRKLTGRPEPVAGGAIPSAAAASVPTPIYEPTDNLFGDARPALPAAPVAPRTTYDAMPQLADLAPGTGAIRIGDGPIRAIGSPTASASAAPGFGAVVSEAVPRYRRGSAAAGVGAMLNIKQRFGDAKQQTAANKLMLDVLLKGPGAAKDSAEAASLQARMDLAKLEKDPARAAAIISGRVAPGDKFSIPPSIFPDATGAVPVLNTASGALQKVMPKAAVQDITMAQAIASAKKNKTYRSDDQVRSDMAKMSGYRLVD